MSDPDDTEQKKAPLSLPLSREAVGELDALIGRAEQHRAEQLAAIERLSAAGDDAGPARTVLAVIEDHLDLLHRTRNFLESGDLPSTGGAAEGGSQDQTSF